MMQAQLWHNYNRAPHKVCLFDICFMIQPICFFIIFKLSYMQLIWGVKLELPTFDFYVKLKLPTFHSVGEIRVVNIVMSSLS